MDESKIIVTDAPLTQREARGLIVAQAMRIKELEAEVERLRGLWLGLQKRLDPNCNLRAHERLTELLSAEAEVERLKGAIAADDERLCNAAAKAGIPYVGCDTPDALASEVQRLLRIEAAVRDYDEILDDIETAEKADALSRFQTDFHRLHLVKQIRRKALRAVFADANKEASVNA